MSGTIVVTLAKLKLPAAGMRGIDVLIDGEFQAELQFGESASIEVSPGTHQVEAILKGVVSRRSKPLSVTVSDDGEEKVLGKYSRLWGSLQLSPA